MNKHLALKACLGLGLGAVSLYLVGRGLDGAELARGFAEARLGDLLLAVPPLAASYYARGLRWRYLFPDSVRRAGLRHATGILLIGFLLNNFLPARAGEFTRALLMARHNEVPVAGTLSTLFVERLFDGFVLGTVGWISLHVIAAVDVSWLQWLTLAFALLFALALAVASQHARVARWIARARLPGRLGHTLRDAMSTALHYLGALASLRAVTRAIVLTALVWACEALSLMQIVHAFDAGLDLARAFGLLSVTNFALLIPIPGGVGAVELAGTSLLGAVGLSRAAAFVVVTTQHLMQYVLCLVLGGIYASRLELTLNDEAPRLERQYTDRSSNQV